MSRYKDLSVINYRKAESNKDDHGVVNNDFSETLYTFKGALRPQNLITSIDDSGVTPTGDYVIYVPVRIQTVDIKQGDGIYLDDDDTSKEPKWFVSNIPYVYLFHLLLQVKSRK